MTTPTPAAPTVILPTVGRVMHYYPEGRFVKQDAVEEGAEPSVLELDPQAAVVSAVNPDGTINITAFSKGGIAGGVVDVLVVQDGDLEPADRPFVRWMPFQIGQAKAQSQAAEAPKTSNLVPLK